MARLGDYVKQIRGVSYKPEDLHASLDDSSIILLRANNIQDGKLVLDDVVFVDKSKVRAEQLLKQGDVLICTSSGSKELVGKAAFVEADMNVTFGAFCKVVRTVMEHPRYLGHYFNSAVYRKQISALSAGANINNIRGEHIDSLEIQIPSINEQVSRSNSLSKIDELISLRKKQLQKLDDLIISRFVEMFGDPVKNTLHLTTMSMDEACEIIDGDRGEYYPKQEDFSPNDYCLFLNAKNVTKNGFDFSNCMYITKEKDKQLRKGKLKRGDIVLTTRGTIGNLAYYSNNVPFENIRINSGMVLLRMKNVLLEQFFIEQFRMLLEEVKRTIASGSAQPQLPISTMNKIRLIVPELARQKQYVNILETISNNRLRIQQGLDNLEQMKQALMQKYFG